jgi:hypothetical protein
MNRPRLARLDRALADLQRRLAPPAPLVLETLADGTLRDYEDPTRTFADLDAYRAAFHLRADEGPLVIMPHLPERDAGAAP